MKYIIILFSLLLQSFCCFSQTKTSYYSGNKIIDVQLLDKPELIKGYLFENHADYILLSPNKIIKVSDDMDKLIHIPVSNISYIRLVGNKGEEGGSVGALLGLTVAFVNSKRNSRKFRLKDSGTIFTTGIGVIVGSLIGKKRYNINVNGDEDLFKLYEKELNKALMKSHVNKIK